MNDKVNHIIGMNFEIVQNFLINCRKNSNSDDDEYIKIKIIKNSNSIELNNNIFQKPNNHYNFVINSENRSQS